MASGKSTLGKKLSEELGFSFTDLDKEIENSQNKSISQIFLEEGELKFRQLERSKLEELLLSEEENQVISLGGGTPMYYDNMALINQYSNSFYLQVKVPVLSQRLKNEKSQRPIIAHLKEEELAEFISKHLFEREAIYRQAQHIIQSSEKTTEEQIEEIKNLIPSLL